MAQFTLYTDETGNFHQPNPLLMIGGLWGESRQFTKRVEDLARGFKQSLKLPAHVNSLAVWSGSKSQRDHELILDLLSEAVPVLAQQELSFATLRYGKDMYRSDSKDHRRFTHMNLTLATNMTCRNPGVGDKDEVHLCAGTRTIDGESVFDQDVFDYSWDTLKDHRLIAPIKFRLQLSAYADTYHHFTPYVFLSDLLLGVYRMVLAEEGPLVAEYQAQLDKLSQIHFNYDKELQLAYEFLVESHLKRDWESFLDQYLLFEKQVQTHDSHLSYGPWAQQYFEDALIKLSQRQADAYKALNWVEAIQNAKEPDKYTHLKPILDALASHPDVQASARYQKCLHIWQNHEGVLDSEDSALPLQQAEAIIDRENTGVIKTHEHRFAFAKALETVELYRDFREEYVTNIVGDIDQASDTLLGELSSHCGYLNAHLHQFDAAYAHLDRAMSLFKGDPLNQSISLSYALQTACDQGDAEKVRHYRKGYLQSLGCKNKDILQRLRSPNDFDQTHPFLLRGVLKSQSVAPEPEFISQLKQIDPNAFLDYVKTHAHHPFEGVLIHWGRLLCELEPEKARQLLLQAEAMSTHNLTLSLKKPDNCCCKQRP